MQKLKQYIQKIKSDKKFNGIINLFWIVLCTFFFTKMVLNLGYVSESLYQTHKDYYFGMALSFFLLAVLLLQRVNLKNIWGYIFLVMYYIIALQWLNANEMNWGEELQNVYRVRWQCGGILGVLLLDAIKYKKIVLKKDRKLFGSIFFLIVALIVCFVSRFQYYSYVLLIPFLYFYLLRIDYKDWKKWICSFTIGYYISFLYTMLKSFETIPYTGERYYGIYINHGLFGIMIGGAFVCTLWWIVIAFQKGVSMWKKALLFIPALFCVICLVINGARVAELSVILTVVIAFCLWGGRCERKQIAYRAVSFLLLAMICLVIIVAILYVINNYDKEHLELLVENDVIRQKIWYWCDRAHTMFNAESKYGVFETGSILNAIDRFSSDRLSYSISYLKDLNWFGHEHLYIEVNGTPFTHPHNTFVYWLYGLGILPGILLIGWNLYYLAVAVQKAVKKRSVYTFSLLWGIYFSVAGLNEDILWIYMAAFILLILQYPLLVNMKNE